MQRGCCDLFKSRADEGDSSDAWLDHSMLKPSRLPQLELHQLQNATAALIPKVCINFSTMNIHLIQSKARPPHKEPLGLCHVRGGDLMSGRDPKW